MQVYNHNHALMFHHLWLPTQSRFDILKIHSRRMNLMRGIDLKKMAEKMNGASGAELKVNGKGGVWEFKYLLIADGEEGGKE